MPLTLLLLGKRLPASANPLPCYRSQAPARAHRGHSPLLTHSALVSKAPVGRMQSHVPHPDNFHLGISLRIRLGPVSSGGCGTHPRGSLVSGSLSGIGSLR